jgi:hypothetical protein
MVMSAFKMEFSIEEVQRWESFPSNPNVFSNPTPFERRYNYSRGGLRLSDANTTVEGFNFGVALKLERLLVMKCDEVSLQRNYYAITIVTLSYSNLATVALTASCGIVRHLGVHMRIRRVHRRPRTRGRPACTRAKAIPSGYFQK